MLRIPYYRIIEYILAITLLINCSSVYSLANFNAWICIAMFWMIMLIVLKIHRLKKRNVLTRTIWNVFIYLAIIIVVSATIRTISNGFIVRFFIIVPTCIVLFSIMTMNEKLDLLRIIGNTICGLTVLSTIIWLLGPLLNILSPNGSMVINWGGMKTYTNYLYVAYAQRIQIKTVGGITFCRNLSIYPEGPFSSLVFIIGLAIHLFFDENISKKRCMLFIIAVISTISTSGIILLGILFILKYFMGKENYKESARESVLVKRLLLTILIIGGGICAFYLIMNWKATTDLGNYSSHMNAFQNGWNAFKEHPLTGYGYTNANNFGNSTSGLFKVLVNGGLPFLVLYMIPYIKILLFSKIDKNFNLLVFGMVLFMLLVLVIWHNTLFYLFFMALGYSLQKQNDC